MTKRRFAAYNKKDETGSGQEDGSCAEKRFAVRRLKMNGMKITKIFLGSLRVFLCKKGGSGIRAVRVIFHFGIAMLALSLAVFYMARLAPGDPLRSYYGESIERMSAGEREAARERLGLDRPIHIQYGLWVGQALEGDLGISLKYKRPVTEVVAQFLPNTLLLGGLGYVLTFGLSAMLGIFCAVREGSRTDRLLCRAGTVLNSVPSFWVALALILLFSVELGWLPSGGAYDMGEAGDFFGRLRHLILPLTVLIAGHLWYYAYLVRNLLLEEFRQEYVLLCRAKGLERRRIVTAHCMRNLMPPLLSLMAVSIPHILGGTYIVEQVFSYPGLGTLCFESAKYHDYHLLMILSLLTGALVVASNMLADAFCGEEGRRSHWRNASS